MKINIKRVIGYIFIAPAILIALKLMSTVYTIFQHQPDTIIVEGLSETLISIFLLLILGIVFVVWGRKK